MRNYNSWDSPLCTLNTKKKPARGGSKSQYGASLLLALRKGERIMKKWMIVGICILGIGLLGFLEGCATAPTPEQLANADYGTYPANYEEIVKSYFSPKLFDPYSAQYRFIQTPYQGWLSSSKFSRGTFGYIVKVGVNAKNRFGGYVGEKVYTILIKNGVVAVTDEFFINLQDSLNR